VPARSHRHVRLPLAHPPLDVLFGPTTLACSILYQGCTGSANCNSGSAVSTSAIVSDVNIASLGGGFNWQIPSSLPVGDYWMQAFSITSVTTTSRRRGTVTSDVRTLVGYAPENADGVFQTVLNRAPYNSVFTIVAGPGVCGRPGLIRPARLLCCTP
jgi:hypothetical protein